MTFPGILMAERDGRESEQPLASLPALVKPIALLEKLFALRNVIEVSKERRGFDR